MADYIPNNDTLFTTWFDRFMAYLTAHVEALGLSEAEIADLVAVFPEYTVAFSGFQDARATYRAKRDAKDDKRAEAEALIRPIVGRIQNYAGTTNEDRQELGIPVKGMPDNTQTIGVVNNKPLAIVDVSQRLTHVLRIQNESSTGTTRAKPKGVKYAEVWFRIGGLPEGNDFQFYGTASKSPMEIVFDDADGNKPVHYRLRWVDTKGNKSSWSEIETATIAA